MLSCKKNGKSDRQSFAKAEQPTDFNYTKDFENQGVIYEVNIRQYSPEGSFNAFTKDIPKLKRLGVKVLWVMPIFPISETKRKGALGSYYAVSDFRQVNPEFGNIDDVDHLIKTAHDNGIAVILDWVPNHTGWDHTWIKTHPEWYTQNEKGEIVDPMDPTTGKSYGWTDVADLNYENEAMKSEMIADLLYWVEEHDVDGYRMDVAHKVPVSFFKRAIDTLEAVKKPLFMLAEAEQPDLMDNGFDMHYAWEMHHLLNDIAKENKNIDDFWQQLTKYDQTLAADHINMYFITNHDENSWAGTLQERMPGRKDIFTALTYMLPGMPLLYSGQEYDLNKRLRFFEKDTIPKTQGNYFKLLETLGSIKNNSKAVHGGKEKAALIKIDLNNNRVLSFGREKDDDQLLFIGNFSDTTIRTSLPYNEVYTDMITNSKVDLTSDNALTLKPWEFYILKPSNYIDFNLQIVPGTND